MEFISSFFLAIAAFFGFGQNNVDEPVENAPVVQVMEVPEEGSAMVQEVGVEGAMELKSDSESSVVAGEAAMEKSPESVKQEQSVTKVGTSWKNYQKPSESVLRQQLSDLAFEVTQNEGTERAGTSPLNKNYEAGIYVDVLSGEPLFSSKDKYDSQTGWPSFTRPITRSAVTEHVDTLLLSTRTEIRSSIANNHLGHVFTDGPKESTGLRYCINGVALRFIPKAEMESAGYGDYLQYIN